MVAKGFLAAAAILICCGATLRGECPDGKCSDGDSTAKSSAKTECSAEGQCCDETKCSDKTKCSTTTVSVDEECCEKKECSTEKCSTESVAATKCSAEKCPAEKCATEKCAGGPCATSDLTAGKCDFAKSMISKVVALTGSKGKCSASKCAASDCVKSECAQSDCAGEVCATGTCAAGECCEQWTLTFGVSDNGLALGWDVTAAFETAFLPESTCATEVECGASECSQTACSEAKCGALACIDSPCSAGDCLAACPAEACASLKCAVQSCLASCDSPCDGGQCADEKCVAEQCSIETCAAGKCGTSSCATTVSVECSKSECAKTECAKTEACAATCSNTACSQTACAPGKCEASQTKLEAKLAELKELQREIASLRRPAGSTDQYVVDVKVLEVNRTKCRSLGFDMEFESPVSADEFAGATCKSLVKNNLAKVLANPTLCVAGGVPASFVAGGEHFYSVGHGEVESEFIGTKVDVLASPVGADKVQIAIAPHFSELCSTDENGLFSTKVRKWDTTLEATIGQTIVMNGMPEARVRTRKVEGREPIEEVEEVQTMLLVTVEKAGNIGPSAAIRQAAYEKSLVNAVQEPVRIVRVYAVPDLQVWNVRPGGVEFDADLLVTHIKATVDPQSWRDGDCAGESASERIEAEIKPFERNGSLVICQTAENHAQIAELLQSMRVASEEKRSAREEAESRGAQRDANVESAGAELELVRKLIVRPVSAEEPAACSAKCGQGACSAAACSAAVCGESKCSQTKCSEAKCNAAKSETSPVSITTEGQGACPGGCEGECNGACPEKTAECPCIGGTCTR